MAAPALKAERQLFRGSSRGLVLAEVLGEADASMGQVGVGSKLSVRYV